ncbi:hypothetical protein C0993_001577 [Termitomyces sp. T159_Od127]|nr:hypothetical protein C0993_001577 [Termitomyces sp. T159_Od127]
MSSTSSASRSSPLTKSKSVAPDVLKPNPHPYAIKTTSTGILSRSSSTSSSVHSYNHYVPVSPSPSPTKQHFSDYSERGSRHRYSRSLTEESSIRPLPVPTEDLYYQHDRRSRSRTGSFSESFEDDMNPKSWTHEQLAANVPEIADFVRENEITGRAFLRFDDGVLDAYGITQHWRRSLILDHCHKLKQSMLHNRNSNTFSDLDARRFSRSDSLTGQHQPPPDDDDSAYLSSSSSISSTSSSGHTKQRLRSNGRVHGLIVSYERCTSPDKTQLRSRSESTSSIHDGNRSSLPQYNGDNHGRPLPFPPQSAREYVTGPLLLPQASFPNSFPQSLNTPQSTGNSSQEITRNDVTNQTTHPTNHSRPLPATPLHPSLRPPVVDEDLADDSAIASKNTSGEMTMDELIAVLDHDTQLNQPQTFINMDRRNAQSKSKKRKEMGAVAWEMDVGETVKHVPATLLPAVVKAQPDGGDDELTVEELLALEGGAGTTAWVNEPAGNEETVKRARSDGHEIRDSLFESGENVGKGVECISLSEKRKSRVNGYSKHQVRHVEELFSLEHEVDDAHREENQFEVDALELERMREIERRLLRAEEEERQQWDSRAAGVVESCKLQEAHIGDGSELLGQDEGLHEVSQRRQCMAEDTQQLRQEPEAEEQRLTEMVAAERQREEERRLASSIAENRRLLQEFQRRLERVEQRVEDLETASAPSLPLETKQSPKASVAQRLRVLAAWALSTSLPAALGVPLSDFVRGPDSDTSISRLGDETFKIIDIRRREKSRTVAAHHSKAFPRYAFIFGLGICAFMMRGFLRLGVKGVRIGATGAKGVKGR